MVTLILGTAQKKMRSLLKHDEQKIAASVCLPFGFSGGTLALSFPLEGFIDVLAAIKREERKLEKQLSKLHRQLNGVRSAPNAVRHSTEREKVGVKKRVLSAAERAAMVKAARKRWAKVRKQAKKAVS
jgi:hypothetical protein